MRTLAELEMRHQLERGAWHGHHIAHWADGGATSLDNIVQLCPHHHRRVHEGGFTVQIINERRPGGCVFRFHRPDGTLINDTVPSMAIEACAETLLKQRNTQLDLVIDETTAVAELGRRADGSRHGN